MTGFNNSASLLYSRSDTQPFVATCALLGLLAAGTGGFYSPQNTALVPEWTGSTAIAISDSPTTVRRKVVSAVSIPRIILQIRERLGLKMSELAEIFGVSRQAVYLWLKGDNLKNEYMQRIWQLNSIAEHVAHAGLDRPEYFVHRPLSPAGDSLFQLLVGGANVDLALTLLREQSQAEQTSRAKSTLEYRTSRARKQDPSSDMELATPILDELDG